jgi:pimeloyl-ACP methyl ester carboxylesterase
VVQAAYSGTPPSQIILVGHSLGGAVVVDVAKQCLLPKIIGVCVIDVVEGTAIASLSHMAGFLASRPSEFASVREAVEWSVESGGTRNIESARISIPNQLSEVGGVWKWRTNLSASKEFWQGWFHGLSRIIYW